MPAPGRNAGNTSVASTKPSAPPAKDSRRCSTDCKSSSCTPLVANLPQKLSAPASLQSFLQELFRFLEFAAPLRGERFSGAIDEELNHPDARTDAPGADA